MKLSISALIVAFVKATDPPITFPWDLKGGSIITTFTVNQSAVYSYMNLEEMNNFQVVHDSSNNTQGSIHFY